MMGRANLRGAYFRRIGLEGAGEPVDEVEPLAGGGETAIDAISVESSKSGLLEVFARRTSRAFGPY
jgi:hypothetical protein